MHVFGTIKVRIQGVGDRMFREDYQLRMNLSAFQGLYDIVVPSGHILRRIKENIDFSFVNPMLKKQYCEYFGRPAKEPEMMFKLLFLKKLYDLSDERLIACAQTDMAYKFFLGLEPEDKIVDPSLLTKFRKTRITQDILDEMLKETILQALNKGLIKNGTIIVDSTHTSAHARPKSHTQVLRELTKQLRKEVYKHAYDLSEKFPEKPSVEAELSTEIEYTKSLLSVVGSEIESCNKKIQNIYNEINSLIQTDEIKTINSKNDKDAKFGYKSANKPFYGYKNHIAMTDSRLITAIEVTDGAQNDGKQLPILADKTLKTGIVVDEIIGDMAYVSEDNLAKCEENEIVLYARTNSAVVASANSCIDEGFNFNKDAGLMQCTGGHLATRCEKRKSDNGNTHLTYCFSVKQCNKCPLKSTCRVGKTKSRSYTITQVTEKNKSRLEFESTEKFNEKLKIRYRIEEKNGELKTAHGLNQADSTGLIAMRLQSYLTAFVVNIKRILTLELQKQ